MEAVVGAVIGGLMLFGMYSCDKKVDERVQIKEIQTKACEPICAPYLVDYFDSETKTCICNTSRQKRKM